MNRNPRTGEPMGVFLGKADKQGSSTLYFAAFGASPEDRIALIRKGVPARQVKRITADLAVEQQEFFDAIGLKTATVNRKVREDEALSSDESERLLGVARMIGQVAAMVAQSGDADGFDAAAWLSRWLREPLPALGGERPISYLDTMEGQSLVSDALSRIQSGAYA